MKTSKEPNTDSNKPSKESYTNELENFKEPSHVNNKIRKASDANQPREIFRENQLRAGNNLKVAPRTHCTGIRSLRRRKARKNPDQGL